MTPDRISTFDLLDLRVAAAVHAVLSSAQREGIPLDVFESARGPERQLGLYRRGRDPTAADYGRTVTRAQPYQSAHQFGLGVDLVFHVGGVWTWDEPRPGLWDRMDELAASSGLEPLSFERPHLQLAKFNWRDQQPGPANDADWLAWLQRRIRLVA